ncbi:MAG: glycosyltransferase family 4 protein [Bacteroidales bacterium]|nr:glycosyltransferase family 4 protein [Candidatus Colicola caccequi]
MKILEVSRYKDNFANHQLPFVTEQGEALRMLGCEVEYFLVRGNYLAAVKELKIKIRTFQPDIVHAHYGLSAITAELQSLCPVVTTFHNGETLTWWVNLLSSLCSLRAKHVIYVAQHIRDLCYLKHPNYTILPCGVPLDLLPMTPFAEARKQLGWSNNKKYIMFGGAFSNLRKNYPLLRDALALLQRNDIEVVEMKGLSRAECTLRMCGCDLFALPTHSEGSPQALKEAMACNCPIVATDCADIAHLLGNLPGHYILRNPRKTKERWDGDVHSVQEMAALVEQGLAFGQRTEGRKRITELHLDNTQVAKQLMDIYRTIVK